MKTMVNGVLFNEDVSECGLLFIDGEVRPFAGHRRSGFSPSVEMSAVFDEITGMKINSWKYYSTFHYARLMIDWLFCIVSRDVVADKNDIVWCKISALPENIASNLKTAINMAIEHQTLPDMITQYSSPVRTERFAITNTIKYKNIDDVRRTLDLYDSGNIRIDCTRPDIGGYQILFEDWPIYNDGIRFDIGSLARFMQEDQIMILKSSVTSTVIDCMNKFSIIVVNANGVKKTVSSDESVRKMTKELSCDEEENEKFTPITDNDSISSSFKRCESFLVKENKLNSEIFLYENYSLNPAIYLDPWRYFDHYEFKLTSDEFDLVG